MTKNELKIVYMGTPDFAVEPLRKLVEGGYNVVGVITMPDKPIGRHQTELSASPVKQYAVEHGLRVLQPAKLKDPEFVEELRSLEADLQIVVAFRMLPEVVWAMPRFGTFNVHAALLPQYRGAAPINWAVINGETETGVTTFFLDHDIDTGRIILQKRFAIPDDADVEYVYDGLMDLGAQAAIETINLILQGNGTIPSEPQDNLAQGMELHGAPKIFKDTCCINCQQPQKRVYDFIRGLSPYPGAWTTYNRKGKDTVLKIFKTAKTQRKATGEPGSMQVDGGKLYANCADEQLQVLELQQSGKRRMQAPDFINGWQNA